ncbi:MAG: type II toxin-antitoxin system VapC family toxin [Candidatus Hadarchaeota archaeon]|nr:type II toxin-antitoxin system VapC family toxin [Candidatus Hadarchaeota archaeon]
MKPALAYIDSNILFYAKIMDTQYGEPCRRIIEDIARAELDATASTLVVLELANALRKYGLEEDVKDEVDAVYSLGMKMSPVDDVVVRRASSIYQKFRISPYDCVHVATMRKLDVSEIITADRDFDKVSGIRRIDPKLYE